MKENFTVDLCRDLQIKKNNPNIKNSLKVKDSCVKNLLMYSKSINFIDTESIGSVLVINN